MKNTQCNHSRARTGIERHQTFIYKVAAIPTRWNGYMFDCRGEARVAYAFDNLDIGHVPQPHQFHILTGEVYTPDFYVGYDPCAYVEVKPRHGDFTKAALFERTVGCRVLYVETPLTVGYVATAFWPLRGDYAPADLKRIAKIVREANTQPFWDSP